MTTPHTRAVTRYNSKNYEQILIRAPKGWKGTVQAAADGEKKSLAGYIREAVEEKMNKQK